MATLNGNQATGELNSQEKESLFSTLTAFKSSIVLLSDGYQKEKVLSRDEINEFKMQGFSLAYVLRCFQTKSAQSLELGGYIREADRIRDLMLLHSQPDKQSQCSQTSQTAESDLKVSNTTVSATQKQKKQKKLYNIEPSVTKEKYDAYLSFQKELKVPSSNSSASVNRSTSNPNNRNPISFNPASRPPDASASASANAGAASTSLNYRLQQQSQGQNPNGNEQDNQFATSSMFSKPSPSVASNNFGAKNQNPTNNFSGNNTYTSGQQGWQQQQQQQPQQSSTPATNQYQQNNPYTSRFQRQADSSNPPSSRVGYGGGNNMGYGRNRFNTNNFRGGKGRFGGGYGRDDDDNDDNQQQQQQQQPPGGTFMTASEQAHMNQNLKAQREEGYFNKDTGRFGRNNGQIELEGVNEPRNTTNRQFGGNPAAGMGVDQAMNMVHYHALGKNLNLNAQTNQQAALCGGGYEDDNNKPKGALSKKFKPPGAPGSSNNNNNNANRPGGANGQSDQLKGMDQKLVDLIESEIVENAANVKWDDIAGLSSAKRAVHESIVWPMLNPQIFTGIRAPPKGLLLFGPPGTGKTMIGKAIACESGSTFFSISASSLTSKYIGEGEKMVKILFKLALARQPSVIFIDEIDSLLCARQENENEASRRIKTEFMVQMEGAQSKGDERILLIGATNRPQELDDAVRRRFVKKLYIPLPNSEAREQLLRRVIHNESEKGTRFDIPEDSLQEVVKITKGYSGADMRNLCGEASLIPIRSCTNIKAMSMADIRPISKEDFFQALRQVKATVKEKDLAGYLEWNNDFGSFEINVDDIDT